MMRHILATCLVIILYTIIMSFISYYVLSIPREMSQFGAGVVIGGMTGRFFTEGLSNDRS
jgi:hypothetical protein